MNLPAFSRSIFKLPSDVTTRILSPGSSLGSMQDGRGQEAGWRQNRRDARLLSVHPLLPLQYLTKKLATADDAKHPTN